MLNKVFLLLLVVAWHVEVGHCAAATKPVDFNRLIGSCLNQKWLNDLKLKLSIDPNEVDQLGRKLHPSARVALKAPRYHMFDPRQKNPNSFTKCPEAVEFWGKGAKLDATTGKVVDRGSFNGSVVIERSGWDSHAITRMIAGIILEEVVGYSVTLSDAPSSRRAAERMSTRGVGICRPTHVNFEIWASPAKFANYRAYENESYNAGSIGYTGRSGIYTSNSFVLDAENLTSNSYKFNRILYADFWKDYRYSQELKNAVNFTAFNKSKVMPTKFVCEDGKNGCRNNCAKTPSCTVEESKGNECVVFVMMYPGYDKGYMQSTISNLKIPAYMCYLGWTGTQDYAIAQAKANKSVLFYHYVPDAFHQKTKGLFARLQFPHPTPEKAKMNNEKYGEGGYGTESQNPVAVDFGQVQLVKMVSSIIDQNPPLSKFVSKLTISQFHINSLLTDLIQQPSSLSSEEKYFNSACNWVRDNYISWKSWITPLPLCSNEHFYHLIEGCSSTLRTITFTWKQPHPENPSLSYSCDGGVALPKSFKSSRSCAWAKANMNQMLAWTIKQPTCDSSFYTYDVSNCQSDTKRTIVYRWLYPDKAEPLKSAECKNGDKLPSSRTIDCDYMPTSSGGFITLVAFTLIIIGVFVLAFLFVLKNRTNPILKRSQYELLLIMIFGAICNCLVVLVGAGEPSYFGCATTPLLSSLGFMIIFGSLFVKSLRVYRVFLNRAFKKTKVTLAMMLKALSIIIGVDILINLGWFIVDFPMPKVVIEEEAGVGDVKHIYCQSSGFIFQALGFFWKGIVLFAGIFISFRIRNVASDFQESIWVFASTFSVLLGCLIVLPLAYAVKMPPAVFYVFRMGATLLTTMAIVVFMLVPKYVKFRKSTSSMYKTSEQTGTDSHPSNNNNNTTTQNGADSEELEKLLAENAVLRKRLNIGATEEISLANDS